MILGVEAINRNNDRIYIDAQDPTKDGFFLVSATGLGSPEGDISMTDRTIIDGAIFNNGRARGRNPVLNIRLFWGNEDEYSNEQLRHRLYRFFPIKQRVKLVFTTETRKVYCEGIVETNEPDMFAKFEQVQISVLCEESYLFGMLEEDISFNGVNPLFEFPWDNNSLTEPLIEFGEIYFLYDYELFYEGEAETGFNMHIEFNESAAGITISNIITGQFIKLSNVSFSSGDTLDICTIDGKKSIIKNNTTNLIDKMYTETANQWVKIIPGTNEITIRDGSGADVFASTTIDMVYQNLYEGI